MSTHRTPDIEPHAPAHYAPPVGEPEPEHLIPAPRAHSTLDYSTTSPSHTSEWAGELIRRFSLPSSYTVDEPASTSAQLVVPNNAYSRTASSASSSNAPHSPLAMQPGPALMQHRYPLKSRGKDYAFIMLSDSRAARERDAPVFFHGDEVAGKISMALENLGGIQRIEVKVRFLSSTSDSEGKNCGTETAREQLQEFVGEHGQMHAVVETQLSPASIDSRFVNHGIAEWPFALSHISDTALGIASSSSPGAAAQRRYTLLVTVFRRGRLTPNAVCVTPVPFMLSSV
jgi:hypothetical protein